MPGHALEGLRVLDLGTGIAGGYATKLLADAGADVVKVEPPGGDPLRRWTASGRSLAPDRDGPLFRFLAASKRSVLADLDRPEERARLLDLAAEADLVFETFTPKQSRALGLEGPALWRRNEAVSLVSLTPFGRTSPWADRPASELVLQALCGSAAARGVPGGTPIAAGGRLGDWLAGAYAAMAGLAGHLGTVRGGRGQHVDVAQLEVMHVTMAPPQALQESLLGRPLAFPRSVETPSIYPARDGWVGFCTITGQQWLDFLVLIERTDLQEDRELAHRDGRTARSAEIDAAARAWTEQHAVEEIVEIAAALRIPVAAIGNGETVLGFDHFVERGVFVPGADGGFVQPRVPYRLSAADPRPFAAAPALGQHGRLSDGALAPWTAARGERENGASASAVDTTPSAARDDQLPFEGLRVVDFTAFWAGPFATQFLAVLGADVVKIESTQRPDGMRFSSTREPNDDRWWEWSSFFQAFNANKKSVTLDLRRPEGIALVRRLLAEADVAIENFSPRVLDDLGIRWDDLQAANPRLVMVRMPAFGLDGPWRDRVGFAQTMEQISGMAWITGERDGPPRIPRGPCDPLAGIHACFALQAALRQRERTGVGQHVEVAMIEVALNVAVEQPLEHQLHGVLLCRDGNRGPEATPESVWACAGEDRWIALSVGDEAQWSALRAWLGEPAWAADAALAT
ncbi:MAG: CoA transferase, partial [Deltaproteobacteria bacterium]|nr:CoA transferase [Deltaproteobacteria bacterium]